MPIPLGILAVAGAGGAGGGAGFELISTTFGNGSIVQIDFSSIPQGFRHLQIRYTVLMVAGGAGASGFMRLNSDTGSNYSQHWLRGNGSAVSSSGGANQSFMNFANPINGLDTTIWNVGVIDLLDYSLNTKFKTMRGLTGMAGTTSTNREISLVSGNWRNTDAITTVSLRFAGFAPTSTSRFSLYGIR